MIDLRTLLTVAFVLVPFAVTILSRRQFNLETPSWLRTGGFSSAATDPTDSVYAMLDAARAGDPKAYLDSFSGAIHDQLLQIVKEESEPKFAAYLKSQNSAIQSVAVSISDRPNEAEATARVEYVYTDRNEVQKLYLRKDSARWRIFKVTSAGQLKVLFPFGAKVTEQ